MKNTTKQWLWFIGLWFFGLFAVALLSMSIRLIMKLIFMT
jgi:uncharacterized SAM-binding protein YcdF (DUF218 family)